MTTTQMRGLVRLRRRFGLVVRIVRRYGVRAGTGLIRQLGSGGDQVAVVPPQIGAPVYIRRHTADVEIFEQIFLRGEYDVPVAWKPAWVLDLGGHIGLSAAWFASRFPDVPVIVVEPEPANFAMLERN